MATYELLADGMARNDGPDYVRGDQVEIEDERLAKALEAAGSIGEPGTLDKVAKEREEAEEARAERVRLDDEEAHRRQAHAADRLAASGPSPEANRAERNAASSDGPRVEKRDGGTTSGRRR